MSLQPEEQLQQVMQDLDHLVNNDSVPIMVESVSTAVDQVIWFYTRSLIGIIQEASKDILEFISSKC